MNDPLLVSHGPTRGSGRIEDACGESPAASHVTVQPCMKFLLFAHYSFIIRSLNVPYREKEGEREGERERERDRERQRAVSYTHLTLPTKRIV